jgi:hypothetical protein
MNRRPHRLWRSIIAFSLLATLLGCSLIGGFNAKSLEHLTSLKAAHMKFIDDFTEGPNKTFDPIKLAEAADKIDLKFREALEYAKSLSDKPRVSNIQLLKEIFELDLENITKKDRLLTVIEAKTLAEPSADAYDRAIKGESIRPGAPSK